jgi:hypothetical protein
VATTTFGRLTGFDGEADVFAHPPRNRPAPKHRHVVATIDAGFPIVRIRLDLMTFFE